MAKEYEQKKTAEKRSPANDYNNLTIVNDREIKKEYLRQQYSVNLPGFQTKKLGPIFGAKQSVGPEKDVLGANLNKDWSE